MNRERVGSEGQGELFKRRRGQIRDAERVSILQEKLYQKAKQLPEEVIDKLKSLLHRMGLSLNEGKTRKIDARTESFNFLGFTIRYDKDIKGRDIRYWNIIPSKKSEQRIRDKVKEYLRTHGHYKAEDVASGLNSIIRGWLNYFSIPGVSYPATSKRRLRAYLCTRLYRYYNRKSQRKSRLY